MKFEQLYHTHSIATWKRRCFFIYFFIFKSAPLLFHNQYEYLYSSLLEIQIIPTAVVRAYGFSSETASSLYLPSTHSANGLHNYTSNQ